MKNNLEGEGSQGSPLNAEERHKDLEGFPLWEKVMVIRWDKGFKMNAQNFSQLEVMAIGEIIKVHSRFKVLNSMGTFGEEPKPEPTPLPPLPQKAG